MVAEIRHRIREIGKWVVRMITSMICINKETKESVGSRELDR